jgi:hypothetical protein
VTTPNPGRDTHYGTYRAAGFPAVDFDDFHRAELPRRLRAGLNGEVAWDVAGVAPLAIQIADRPGGYSFVCRDGVVEVVPGVVDDAATILEIIDHESWIDYLHEFRTRTGLLYARSVRFLRGNFETWDDWDPAIRCMYSGRQIYDPSRLDFHDRRGEPLDLKRSFGREDDPEEMSHFLRTTGFLVVRKVFESGLVADLAGEVDRIAADAVEGELT